jgi:hypothetical protein
VEHYAIPCCAVDLPYRAAIPNAHSLIESASEDPSHS